MIFLSYFIFLFIATQQLSKIKEEREHLATNKWWIVVLYTKTRDDIFCIHNIIIKPSYCCDDIQ